LRKKNYVFINKWLKHDGLDYIVLFLV
jgi:hypothetical protein